MSTSFLLAMLVIAVIYGVVSTCFAYEQGRYRERMANIKRASEASDLFFAGHIGLVASWSTSLELINYVAGVSGLPDDVTYDYLDHVPSRVTFKRVDREKNV